MAPLCSFSLLILSASFFIIYPFSSASSARQDAIDVSSACPHLLTTSSLKNRVPSNDTFLVVVPWKVGFEQFVLFNSDACLIDGFSVQVFLQALRRMHPHPLHYKFVLHGNGYETPRYDDMIAMVARGEVDAVVADLTITKERMERVGFTTPYLASALVMVTPFRYGSAGTLWDFLKPFSKPLWIALLGCFAGTGVALYLLENRNPDFSSTPPRPKNVHISSDAPSPDSPDPSSHGDAAPGHTASAPPSDNSYPPHWEPSDPFALQRPGPPIYNQASHRRRVLNAYWFTSLCIFAAQQEAVRTHLGRCVTLMWLFVLLILNSSYTASLASLLSAQKMYPTIEGFQQLLLDTNVSVGYQEGSFLENYMKTIHMDQHRLRNFASEREYVKALKEGNLKPEGVGAVLDELPYIQILLQLECFLTKSPDDDNLPSFGGFGFAFRRNSQVMDDVSKMIVAMKEDGTLKKLQNGWGIGSGKEDKCSSSDEPSHLRFKSFGGLFSILGGVYVICIAWRLSGKVIQARGGRCSFIITDSLACTQGFSNICRRASLSMCSNKVSDVSLEHDSS